MALHLFEAPFAPEHVWALNRFQGSGQPPFRCPEGGVLVAKINGWVCPECGFRQNWAWKEMLVDMCGEVAGNA